MRALILPLLLMSLTGCGAFADAANSDGGTPDAGSTLKISPQFISRGKLNEFELTFTLGPPWTKEYCKSTYITEFDTGSKDLESYTSDYHGGTVVNATMHARSNATAGELAITVVVACDKPGKPQQLHSEWGKFFVLDPDQADGGSQ